LRSERTEGENPFAAEVAKRHTQSLLRSSATPAQVFSNTIMPTYEYECQTCGHPFEAKQSMKDPHLTDCPVEGCPGPVKRKIGLGAGFIFKGNGFYITDYRSDSYKAAAKKDSESAAASTSSAPAATSPTPAASAPAPAKTTGA
jgi:putative FmdB family regulatory protein